MQENANAGRSVGVGVVVQAGVGTACERELRCWRFLRDQHGSLSPPSSHLRSFDTLLPASPPLPCRCATWASLWSLRGGTLTRAPMRSHSSTSLVGAWAGGAGSGGVLVRCLCGVAKCGRLTVVLQRAVVGPTKHSPCMMKLPPDSLPLATSWPLTPGFRDFPLGDLPMLEVLRQVGVWERSSAESVQHIWASVTGTHTCCSTCCSCACQSA